MTAIATILTALALLLAGDFVATFGYHVPEHVFGKFHNLVHHSADRSFVRYAIRQRRPGALFAGFLSALPYLIFIPWLAQVSVGGVVLGLGLAQAHVLWRHQEGPDYATPDWLQTLCRGLGITTPERHQLHHHNGRLAFGDIFAFYGEPAQGWLRYLLKVKRALRQRKPNLTATTGPEDQGMPAR